MKKIWSILMVLMLMISISSLAFADESEENNDEEINEETEKEIEIMNNSLGAEIRLLQLEKSITKNLLKGNMIVDVLEGLGYNTTNLIAILAEMGYILEEVQTADPEANDSVEVFIDLKTDARNLTTQFRITLKDLLSDVKYKEVKEQIRENLSDELQNYSKQIRNRIKQFNRNQIYRLYGIVGEGNNSLVNKYMNGSSTMAQVKLQINKMVNNKTREKKMKIFSELKKEKIQNKFHASTEAENAVKNFTQRETERLQKRLEQAQNSGNEKLIEQIQNRIQNIQDENGNSGSGNGNSGSGNGKGKGK